MPKQKYDFSKEMIFYMIKCNDESVKDIYVGSTFDFTSRKFNHKSACNNEKGRLYNIKTYQILRLNGGWDNWNMNVIERKIVLDKLEARQYEQTLIEKHNANMNSIKACCNQDELVIKRSLYYQTHKEESALYYQTHKEEKQEKYALYYQQNKETYKTRAVLYKQEHKEKVKAYQASYRAKQKEKRNLLLSNTNV